MANQCNQEKVYSPLIKQFKSDTASLYQKLWVSKNPERDLSGLFIPHALPDYGSGTKVFYVGQDTYEWVELSKLFSLSEKDYLNENNRWPSKPEDILEQTNPYTFWNFVCRLQLAFNGLSNENLSNLDSQQIKALNSIGWGNIFPLEIPETVVKYGVDFNNAFDHDVYNQLLNKSHDVSRLKNLLAAYDPDYIVILAWKYVEDWLLECIDYEFIPEESIDSLLSCYRIKGTNKKIFWTYHPQALCRKGQNLDELIDIIMKRL